MAMKFWGVEVKAKVPLTVSLEKGSIIHVSQVTLGNLKKDNETVIVHVKTGEKKLVLGMLSQKTPQLSFDLVFHEDFEISHDLKNGSIHLMGYQSEMPEEYPFSEEEDEDLPVAKENGQIGAPAGRPLALKPQVDNKSKPDEDERDDSSDDSEDEDDSDSDDISGDEDDGIPDMAIGEDESETDSDEEESEEEKPSNAASGKKRPADAKTPQSKKAKIATPQKTDGKKGAAHQATPHPNKKGGDKTPKSGGSDLSCGPCKKTFKNDSALQSHTKAKYSGKK